jgi:hypothetical protein
MGKNARLLFELLHHVKNGGDCLMQEIEPQPLPLCSKWSKIDYP